MRVLVVDDSPVLRMLVRAVLESEGAEVRVAESGERALEMLESYTPDIITMDIHMPGMDGCATTARILERYALPVVVLTATAVDESLAVGRALEAGALAVLQKPTGPDSPDFMQCAQKLVRTLNIMAQVKVVRRYPERQALAPSAAGHPHGTETILRIPRAMPPVMPHVVAVGASAGGPAALKPLLQQLHPDPPWSMLVAQHIASGFIKSYCHWLSSICSLQVRIASQGQPLQPGTLYLAPEGAHLGIGTDQRLQLDACAHERSLCPSADHLFSSVATAHGNRAIGIQLSGMGRDGASGLAELKRRGGLTLVQDPSSAVIDSMPRSAIELGAACEVLSPAAIAAVLNAVSTHFFSRSPT